MNEKMIEEGNLSDVQKELIKQGHIKVKETGRETKSRGNKLECICKMQLINDCILQKVLRSFREALILKKMLNS